MINNTNLRVYIHEDIRSSIIIDKEGQRERIHVVNPTYVALRKREIIHI